MHRQRRNKVPDSNTKYKLLLEECLKIEYENFEEAIHKINEIAVSLLNISCSSVWIVSEINQTLQCEDIFSTNIHKHKKLRASLPLEKYEKYIQKLTKERHLLLKKSDKEDDLHYPYLKRYGITQKLDTALYYKGRFKGVLCFETTEDRFIEDFVYEVATTLANIAEIAINLKYKKENEELFHAIVENPQTGIIIFQEKILYANEAASSITGFANEELTNMHTWEFVYGDIKKIFKQRVLKRLQGKKFSTSYDDIKIKTKNGVIKIIRASVETIVYEGRYAGIAIITDVTDLIEAKEKVKILAQAVEQMDELVKITDVDGNIVYVNNSLIANTGYKEIELIGQNPRILKSGKHTKAFYKKMWDTILSKKIYRNVLINKKKDGSLYYEDLTISPILDKNGDISYFVATSKDVSSQIELEERLKIMATTDALTGIYNRYKMNEEIEFEIKKSKRYKKSFALIMFDIDFFKVVNDTYGHDIGDRVLEELAQVVRHNIRATDTFARWGGEEFMILARNSDEDSATLLAEKIRKKVENFLFADKISITISIGISIYRANKKKETLLKEADRALYRAKAQGRNKTVLFDSI